MINPVSLFIYIVSLCHIPKLFSSRHQLSFNRLSLPLPSLSFSFISACFLSLLSPLADCLPSILLLYRNYSSFLSFSFSVLPLPSTPLLILSPSRFLFPFTWSEDAVTVLPAVEVQQQLDDAVLHQHEHRRHLKRVPVGGRDVTWVGRRR